ncbi:hypothetical protein LSUE1_G000628 [Lachnellula suecica]|uniref:Uncharacterized protein n=1 Tax=Lachnellula suecica TaxID=602035 RepID=A0A8T9CFW2_9HELO|nr:hypothetical protein LSUE1_G000628 [Lachnellula suecica]
MVILGGLEVVAAGYLIHKHQKHKKEKERLEDERADLEEQQYLRPHRRHRSRSDSRGRHSHHRRHSHDGRYKHDSPGPNPSAPKPALKPALKPGLKPTPYLAPQPIPQQSMNQPPPRYDAHSNPQPRPQDVKYGWTDDNHAPAVPPPQQQAFPVTGWPAEWSQSQHPASNTHLDPHAPYQRGESSRGRSDTRGSDTGPRVRFTKSNDDRGRVRSPPPKYRP